MTSRDLYEAALVELNKLKAPSLLLEDYNYFINKAIQQYVNLVYNRYDLTQQSTDDLRVLKSTGIYTPEKIKDNNGGTVSDAIYQSTYYINLPWDYMHILNCILEYQVQTNYDYKCYKKNSLVQFPCARLTSDMFSGILNNAYLRPTYKRPYYFINCINDANGNDSGGYSATATKLDGDIKALKGTQTYDEKSHAESTKAPGTRLANASLARLELRFGLDDTVFKPNKVYIDYIKAPMHINLTMEDINKVEDTTMIVEFPDYVCIEIINIFTRLVMENASDPRLQTNMPLNNTIAAGQVQQQQK